MSKTKTLTPLAILKRAAAENPYNWELPTSSVEKLFKKFENHNNLTSSETIQAYAEWLRLRMFHKLVTSHLDLCRIWFVCEMGYATEEEQSYFENEYFS